VAVVDWKKEVLAKMIVVGGKRGKKVWGESSREGVSFGVAGGGEGGWVWVVVDERRRIARREVRMLRVVQMASFRSRVFGKRCVSGGLGSGAGCS